ncbi:MAG: hypothetical protein WDW36_007123 [Sanguina aurantia]
MGNAASEMQHLANQLQGMGPEEKKFLQAVFEGKNTEAVAALQANPNLIYARSGAGINAWHISAERGDLSMLDSLATHSKGSRKPIVGEPAPVNFKSRKGQTPLMVACQEGHQEAMQMMLAIGANVLDTDNYGNTCIHYAAYKGQMKILEILLNSSEADGDGESDNRFVDLKNEAGLMPLHFAVWGGQPEAVRSLMGCKSRLNPRSSTDSLALVTCNGGSTPLHLAAMKGNAEIATLLLDYWVAMNTDPRRKKPVPDPRMIMDDYKCIPRQVALNLKREDPSLLELLRPKSVVEGPRRILTSDRRAGPTTHLFAQRSSRERCPTPVDGRADQPRTGRDRDLTATILPLLPACTTPVATAAASDSHPSSPHNHTSSQIIKGGATQTLCHPLAPHAAARSPSASPSPSTAPPTPRPHRAHHPPPPPPPPRSPSPALSPASNPTSPVPTLPAPRASSHAIALAPAPAVLPAATGDADAGAWNPFPESAFPSPFAADGCVAAVPAATPATPAKHVPAPSLIPFLAPPKKAAPPFHPPTPQEIADAAVAEAAARVVAAAGAAALAARIAALPPTRYLCPITDCVMEDPVTAADGRVYERAAVEMWLELGNTEFPGSGVGIDSRELVANDAVRGEILAWRGRKAEGAAAPAAATAAAATAELALPVAVLPDTPGADAAGAVDSTAAAPLAAAGGAGSSSPPSGEAPPAAVQGGAAVAEVLPPGDPCEEVGVCEERQEGSAAEGEEGQGQGGEDSPTPTQQGPDDAASQPAAAAAADSRSDTRDGPVLSTEDEDGCVAASREGGSGAVAGDADVEEAGYASANDDQGPAVGGIDGGMDGGMDGGGEAVVEGDLEGGSDFAALGSSAAAAAAAAAAAGEVEVDSAAGSDTSEDSVL